MLNALLKLHPKTTAGGRFYQRRNRETAANFTLRCSLHGALQHRLPVPFVSDANTSYVQTQKLELKNK